MGMFDYVEVPPEIAKCECGASLEFQTKDREWPDLSSLPFTSVEYFYTLCFECDRWIEYSLRLPEPVVRTLADYERRTTTRDERLKS